MASYTKEYKDATVTMYMDHSMRDTAIKMGVSTVTVVSWYKQAVAQGGAQRHNKIGDDFFTLAEKHEACQYYSTHTGDQTVEKTGVSLPSLHKWRKDLGYPNKHYGRNIKHDRTDNDVKSFKVTKTASGKYRASILEGAVAALTAAVVALKELEQ